MLCNYRGYHVYGVGPANVTPDEPYPGLYWSDDEGFIHGPFNGRAELYESIDNHISTTEEKK